MAGKYQCVCNLIFKNQSYIYDMTSKFESEKDQLDNDTKNFYKILSLRKVKTNVTESLLLKII